MNFLSWECSESVIVSTLGEFESTLNFEDFLPLFVVGENFGFLHFGDNDRYHRYIAQRCISYGTICNQRNQCMYISLYLCLSYEWSPLNQPTGSRTKQENIENTYVLFFVPNSHPHLFNKLDIHTIFMYTCSVVRRVSLIIQNLVTLLIQQN